MQNRLPSEIVCETPLMGQARYRLPRRKLGWISTVGAVLVAIALGGGLVGLGLAVASAWQSNHAAFELLAMVLFSFPWVFITLVLLVVGMALCASRTDIEITRDELRVTDWIGPYPWRRHWLLHQIEGVELCDQTVRSNGVPVQGGPLHGLGAIQVQIGEAKPGLVTVAYPAEWLEPLAHDLANQLQRSTGRRLHVARAENDPLDLRPAPAPAPDVLDQPPASRVRMEVVDHGLTLHIPPAGLLSGSSGLFWFSLFWLAFMAVFTTIMIFATADGPAGSMLLVGAIVALFWGVGLGMMAGALNMGLRRATIAVAGTTLMVLRQGPFGTRHNEWDRAQLAAIRVGPSGMSVNKQPVLELQFHQADGHKFGMLAGRDVAELQWIATHLRLALDLPTIGGARADDVAERRTAAEAGANAAIARD